MSEKYKFRDGDGIYFITPTISLWIDLFTKKEYCEIILDSLRYCQKIKGLIIHAWCIMPSHVHMIISSSENLSDIMRDFKTFTSKSIMKEIENGTDSRRDWIKELLSKEAELIKRNKNYKVWQDGNHPVQLDNNKMLDERLNYLHMNPVEAGIVEEAEAYCYSSARDYAEMKGMLDVVLIE